MVPMTVGLYEFSCRTENIIFLAVLTITKKGEVGEVFTNTVFVLCFIFLALVKNCVRL